MEYERYEYYERDDFKRKTKRGDWRSNEDEVARAQRKVRKRRRKSLSVARRAMRERKRAGKRLGSVR